MRPVTVLLVIATLAALIAALLAHAASHRGAFSVERAARISEDAAASNGAVRAMRV